MLLFRYFPTNSESLLIWSCSSFIKNSPVTSPTSPSVPQLLFSFLFSRFSYSSLIHSCFEFFFSSFYFNDSLLQFCRGGYCGGKILSFFSHVKPNTAVHVVCALYEIVVWFIHRELHYMYKTPSMLLCLSTVQPPPPPAELIQHH